MKYTKKHEAAWKIIADTIKTIGTSLFLISLVGMLIETEQSNNHISVYVLFFFASPILILLSALLSFITTIDTNDIGDKVDEKSDDISGRGG